MTGRYPFRCGMLGNPVPQGDYGSPDNDKGDNLGLPTSEITLGQVFQAAGYRTCCIGKWHLGHKEQFRPTRRGFDDYLGILYSNDMHPVELLDGEQVVEFPVQQSTLTKRYTERALQFITANRERPFFLYLPHAMPHKPLAASDDFYKKSGAGLYGDAVAELDWSVGEVLARLKELKLDNQTLVFFSSDNGPWFGGSTGGLRGMKSQWWEGGLRVPLIARWPGVIPPGHISHEPAMIGDLFVTALQAAQVEPPTDRKLDGRDILPLLRSEAQTPHEGIVSWQGVPRTVRSGRWKLHVRGTPPPGTDLLNDDWIDPRAPNGTTLLAPAEQYLPSAYPGIKSGDRTPDAALFDLESDPAEQHDVAAMHADVIQRLKTLFDSLTKVDVEPAR